MNPEEIEEMEGYMDVVRNHRERAFDEGAREMNKLHFLAGTHPLTLPDNPYRIKKEDIL